METDKKKCKKEMEQRERERIKSDIAGNLPLSEKQLR